MPLFKGKAKTQEQFERRKTAADKANDLKNNEEEALTRKVNQKGGIAKLSPRELEVAKRMEGEGKHQGKVK